jgi:hypothetical protein
VVHVCVLCVCVSIVVEGVEAFAEDSWSEIRIGDMEMRVVKPCARCKVPNTNQVSPSCVCVRVFVVDDRVSAHVVGVPSTARLCLDSPCASYACLHACIYGCMYVHILCVQESGEVGEEPGNTLRAFRKGSQLSLRDKWKDDIFFGTP